MQIKLLKLHISNVKKRLRPFKLVILNQGGGLSYNKYLSITNLIYACQISILKNKFKKAKTWSIDWIDFTQFSTHMHIYHDAPVTLPWNKYNIYK